MSGARFGRVLTAMVTPFDASGRIDSGGVCRMIEHLLANGSDGLVVCGTTGESPTLTHEEKLGLFRSVRAQAGAGKTVIAGTGSSDTAASIELTREAEQCGADAALLVVPPYNRPSQEGLYRHFRAIAESVPDLPCMLYNVPSRTSQNLEAGTTLRLARDVSNVVAVKEASGNLIQISEIAAGAPEGFEIYSGDDALTLPIAAVGGVGVVSVTSHLVGRDIQLMLQAFFAGRIDEAARLHGNMLPIVRACFPAAAPSPAPLKAALEIMGLCAGSLRLPLAEAGEPERAAIHDAIKSYGLLH